MILLLTLGGCLNGGRLTGSKPSFGSVLIFVQKLISQLSSITARCCENPVGQSFGELSAINKIVFVLFINSPTERFLVIPSFTNTYNVKACL